MLMLARMWGLRSNIWCRKGVTARTVASRSEAEERDLAAPAALEGAAGGAAVSAPSGQAATRGGPHRTRAATAAATATGAPATAPGLRPANSDIVLLPPVLGAASSGLDSESSDRRSAASADFEHRGVFMGPQQLARGAAALGAANSLGAAQRTNAPSVARPLTFLMEPTALFQALQNNTIPVVKNVFDRVVLSNTMVGRECLELLNGTTASFVNVQTAKVHTDDLPLSLQCVWRQHTCTRSRKFMLRRPSAASCPDCPHCKWPDMRIPPATQWHVSVVPAPAQGNRLRSHVQVLRDALNSSTPHVAHHLQIIACDASYKLLQTNMLGPVNPADSGSADSWVEDTRALVRGAAPGVPEVDAALRTPAHSFSFRAAHLGYSSSLVLATRPHCVKRGMKPSQAFLNALLEVFLETKDSYMAAVVSSRLLCLHPLSLRPPSHPHMHCRCWCWQGSSARLRRRAANHPRRHAAAPPQVLQEGAEGPAGAAQKHWNESWVTCGCTRPLPCSSSDGLPWGQALCDRIRAPALCLLCPIRLRQSGLSASRSLFSSPFFPFSSCVPTVFADPSRCKWRSFQSQLRRFRSCGRRAAMSRAAGVTFRCVALLLN